MSEQWVLDLVREFSPKVVPVDLDDDGNYSELDTRWGLNPIWSAVPRAIRAEATSGVSAGVRAYWDTIEQEPR